MIVVVFFVIAIISLFGFGQVLSARNREKTVASSFQDIVATNKKKLSDRLAKLMSKPKPQKPTFWDRFKKPVEKRQWWARGAKK